MRYPSHLLKLIETLKRLPGVGSKSAERFAFDMLNWPTAHLEEMQQIIATIPDRLSCCSECGCLQEKEDCLFCSSKRTSEVICVVAHIKDVFTMENTREYTGLYHVLGGLLSPLSGCEPKHLNIDKLKARIAAYQIKEVVVALDSTLEGDATALLLKKELAHFPIQISRLAFGLPMGSSLDFIDKGTLTQAFLARGHF